MRRSKVMCLVACTVAVGVIAVAAPAMAFYVPPPTAPCGTCGGVQLLPWADVALGVGSTGSSGGGGHSRHHKRRHRRHGHRPRFPRTTAHQRAKLVFKLNAGIKRADEQQAAKAFAESYGFDPSDPQEMAQITTALDQAISSFEHTMKRGRLHAYNLGDVAAYSLVSAYLSYHHKQSVRLRSTRVISRQIRDVLASQRKVRRLSDAKKQSHSDGFEIAVIVRQVAVGVARQTPELSVADALADLKRWVRANYHVNLARLKLTKRHGFVLDHRG